MIEWLGRHPTAYLDEMAGWLDQTFGIRPSISTVYRTLERARWSHKRTSRRAVERDAVLRAAWHARRLQHDESELVFIDESASNERTGDRRYGWSPEGVAAVDTVSGQRSKRYSILPALTIDGYIREATLIVQGSITGEIFEAWLQHWLLPALHQRPGRSVVIMDNASIHHGRQVEQVFRDAGIDFDYLPPYSPDFNPIEATFADMKAWMRRERQLMEQLQDFSVFLYMAIYIAGGRNARAHFRHAGYGPRVFI